MQDSAAGAITNRRYTTAVSKGAAMVDETRGLLQYWRPGEPLDINDGTNQAEASTRQNTKKQEIEIINEDPKAAVRPKLVKTATPSVSAETKL